MKHDNSATTAETTNGRVTITLTGAVARPSTAPPVHVSGGVKDTRR